MNENQYGAYVKEVTPTHNTFLNMAKAFLVGGTICVIGEGINQYLVNGMGLEKEAAGTWMLIILIFASVLLTGLNIFPGIVKFGGAGALVPITGFANSVIAPAIEYKSEGHVFGIGCKIFTIAGPVIVFGVFASWIFGLLYQILASLGLM